MVLRRQERRHIVRVYLGMQEGFGIALVKFDGLLQLFVE